MNDLHQSKKTSILVSVCCITYNHEAFLAQTTAKSVLMEETDFAVEMVIGEDCSPDATRAIEQDYERRYPGRVPVFLKRRFREFTQK